VNIAERHQWSEVVPRGTPPRIVTPTPRLWLHHGASGSSTVNTARAYVRHHVHGRGWTDVGYSFLIAGGEVLEGRGAGRAGAHTRGDNATSHGICMVGDYHHRVPDSEDIDALVELVAHGHRRGWWPDYLTGGHRDAPGATTLCPGDALHRLIPTINRRVADRLAPQEDHALTPEQARKLDEVHQALLGDRNVVRDLQVSRLGIRAIAAKLGLPVRYDVPDEVEA